MMIVRPCTTIIGSLLRKQTEVSAIRGTLRTQSFIGGIKNEQEF